MSDTAETAACRYMTGAMGAGAEMFVYHSCGLLKTNARMVDAMRNHWFAQRDDKLASAGGLCCGVLNLTMTTEVTLMTLKMKLA